MRGEREARSSERDGPTNLARPSQFGAPLLVAAAGVEQVAGRGGMDEAGSG
jgi:hypothetical protein